MNGHYILPGELVALMAFVFAPPLLLALAGQLLFLRGRLRIAALTFIATCVASLLIGAALLPIPLPQWLGIQDLQVVGQNWPVMPLAFVIVVVVAPTAAVFASRRAGQ